METEVKKRNLFQWIAEYVHGSNEEIRKVTWPPKSDVIKYVTVILAASLIVAAVFALFDWGLTIGLEELIKLTSN